MKLGSFNYELIEAEIKKQVGYYDNTHTLLMNAIENTLLANMSKLLLEHCIKRATNVFELKKDAEVRHQSEFHFNNKDVTITLSIVDAHQPQRIKLDVIIKDNSMYTEVNDRSFTVLLDINDITFTPDECARMVAEWTS